MNHIRLDPSLLPTMVNLLVLHQGRIMVYPDPEAWKRLQDPRKTVHVCNFILVVLPYVLRYDAYVKKQLFLHNLLQNNAIYVERGLLHSHIVYSNGEMLGKTFRKPQFFSRIFGAQSGGKFSLYRRSGSLSGSGPHQPHGWSGPDLRYSWMLFCLCQMHFVHYSNEYNSTEFAANETDGLAVLGIFLKV